MQPEIESREPVTPKDFAVLREQLGRTPKGVQQIMRRNPAGLPAVIRVKSLVDGTPFPTLFWLSDVNLSRLVSSLESDGTMQSIQSEIDESELLRAGLVADNQAYAALRARYFETDVNEGLTHLGIQESFAKKGIGGNSNFSRVRCLHAYVAGHSIQPNTIGSLLEERLGKKHPLIRSLSALS